LKEFRVRLRTTEFLPPANRLHFCSIAFYTLMHVALGLRPQTD
jgi:hypothetical protein